jgi:hypothetical protein
VYSGSVYTLLCTHTLSHTYTYAYTLSHSDGGEYSAEYGVSNLLTADDKCYCTKKAKNVMVLFKLKSGLPFHVTKGVYECVYVCVCVCMKESVRV